MDGINQTTRALLIATLLGVLTLAVFWPVLHNDFIRYDDPLYVVENPHVLGGLTWQNVKWALHSGHTGNWYPVTWLSHMLDVQFFGLRPAGHHLVSLLLHTANVMVLFLLLWRLTGAQWPGAFVAAFFGLHPLHVESVAWVAERKDVLSTFFFLLTLLAYTQYAKSRAQSQQHLKPAVGTEGPTSEIQAQATPVTYPARWYVLTLALFALGLMSKPMLVTLPFVFLLLDWWPLNRFDFERARLKTGLALVWEKAPFFFLALVAGILTVRAQAEGHAVVVDLPFRVRAANAVVSYADYLSQTIWPAKLAVFYPHPCLRYASLQAGGGVKLSELWPGWRLPAAALLLAAVSLLAVLRWKRQPWFAMGWLWYAGTLVPVIGIVQAGIQARADRYTYIPLIGIFIMGVWGANRLLQRGRAGRVALAMGGLTLLAAYALVTRQQLRYWRTDLALFKHALAVTADNPVAHSSVGMDFGKEGKIGLAVAHLRKAVALAPQFGNAASSLAVAYEIMGNPDLALEQYQAAVELLPWDDSLRIRLARVLLTLGRRKESLSQYAQATQLNPDNFEGHYQLGLFLSEQGELTEAATHLAQSLRLNPDNSDARLRLAQTHVKQGQFVQAEAEFRELVRRFPTNIEMRINLGGVLWKRGSREEAQAQYAEAVRLDPSQPVAHFNLGTALSAHGRLPEAASHFAEAVKLKPDYLEAFTELGRALAGQGKFSEAQDPFAQAVRLDPTNANLHMNLGSALMLAGQTNEAATAFADALRLEPKMANRSLGEARVLAGRGQFRAALARLNTALWLRPDWPTPLSELAWMLATCPQADIRDGRRAVELAERALKLSDGAVAASWAALDAAYAETGRFEEAIQAAEKTRQLAVTAGQKEAAQAAETRLALYRSHQPYRQ